MKTMIYSIFAILLCFILSINSVNAGAGCSLSTKECWAFGYPSIGAETYWTLSGTTFSYDLLAEGTDAVAGFVYNGTAIGARSFPSLPYVHKTGSRPVCPCNKQIHVVVSESNYSSAWVKLTW